MADDDRLASGLRGLGVWLNEEPGRRVVPVVRAPGREHALREAARYDDLETGASLGDPASEIGQALTRGMKRGTRRRVRVSIRR